MSKKNRQELNAAKVRALALESVRTCRAISLGVGMIGELGIRVTNETDPVRSDDLKDAMTSLAVLLANGQYHVSFLGAWADLIECETLKPPESW